METFKRVVKILENCSGSDKISRQSSLADDLALDSLGMIMLLIALEEEFEIELDASDLDPAALHTAGDIAELAEQYLAAKEEA